MAVKFRESQRRVIEEYNGGLMGISAVPGSGKTFTLSHLAARLVEKVIAGGNDEQEVLIVTFSNSGVNSFKKRISDILERERKLLPYVGYRVRTLHGLAHDIVRERPALVGLAEDFQIVDERIAAAILQDVVNAHLSEFSGLIEQYMSSSLNEGQMKRVQSRDFPELLVQIAERFIKNAKDNQITPAVLFKRLEESDDSLELAKFGATVYADYQRTLAFRGAVDFDDLVGLALAALELDPQYLARLQDRYVYILEDEAQDSSRLQEKMLRLLTKERNWVRVGDPNQAINTTFTTADSEYLVRFLAEKGVTDRKLPVSGRSGEPIINLANELVRWTTHDHPVKELRGAFFEQYIKPTEADDPQQNPPADETRIHIHYEPDMMISPENELDIVRKSLEKWLSENQDKTVALLVPENSRGFKLAENLRANNIEYEELLRSTTGTRVAASYLCSILNYLAAPHEANVLARFYRDVWLPLSIGPAMDDNPDYERVSRALAAMRYLEDLLWSETPPVETLRLDDLGADVAADLDVFLDFVRYCLAALALPIDQLILTIGQRIFSQPVEIALTYKISALLRRFAVENPLWRLTDFVSELRSIVDNQRRFIGFEDSSEGYSPSPGLPTISTMHAAKGLEWDRVYLLGVSNYGFPSVQPYDNYVSERWFVESKLSLVDEALEQFQVLMADRRYVESVATYEARLAYSSERLRLLYVAITRARRDLVVTWNIGKFTANTGTVNRLALPVLGIMNTVR